MRTRFLNIDYFTHSSSLKTLESTPEFLRLSIPYLPPHPNISASDDLPSLPNFSIDISLEIESLPIQNALSKFFSDVLPQSVDLNSGALEITPSNTGLDSSHDDRIPEEENAPNFTNKASTVHQFETLEIGLCLDNSFFSDKEEMQIGFEYSEIEINLDMVKPKYHVPCPLEVYKSIYSVQDSNPEYHLQEDTYVLGDTAFPLDQNSYNNGSFPVIEVDEISLHISTVPSISQGLLFHFENDDIYNTLKDVQAEAVDAKELLGSIINNINGDFSCFDISKQPAECQLDFVNSIKEMDTMSIIEMPYRNQDCLFNEGSVSVASAMSLLRFDEYQILDVALFNYSEVIIDLKGIDQTESCDPMKDMNLRSFNELIVSQEMALLDGTFKSLPTPILADFKEDMSLYIIVDKLLAELKPQLLSASDGMYLDWSFWEKDERKYCSVLTFQDSQKEIDLYSIDFNINSVYDEKSVYEFVFSSENSYDPSAEENQVSFNMPTDDVSLLKEHVLQFHLDNECSEPEHRGVLPGTDAEKVSLLSRSISQFSDLDFFLNPKKGTLRGNAEPPGKICKTKNSSQGILTSDLPCAPPTVQLEKQDIQLHRVKLSDSIFDLIDILKKNYLALVDNETELKKTFWQSVAADHYKLLALPTQLLMGCIEKTRSLQTSTDDRDGNIMSFVTLSAIKHIAWYLCFYGIHTTYSYINRLYQSNNCLKVRLSFFHSWIQDAYEKADIEIVRSHPSLSVIQEVLRSNIIQSHYKALIVADQAFWCALKKLLTSMGILYHENESQGRACESIGFRTTMYDALRESDCLLTTHRTISATFPFNEFSIILEYGAPCGLSRISTMLPTSAGSPRFHFLKVELEDPSTAKALSEGLDWSQDTGFTMKLEDLLNFVLIKDSNKLQPSEAVNKFNLHSTCITDASLPSALQSECFQPREPSFKDIFIVVNTQNSAKEMLISRRTTYQRILAMEKEGAQVVERDSILPADIIISPAICLLWYDCRSIENIGTAPEGASSCLSWCLEDIATNILTLLSFSFKVCILIFEGEVSFLSAIMESSDGLYAASASLGIDLQIFYSYSIELTDEIVMSCIGQATRLVRGLYPKMPESETLAEFFLTKFPSVNAFTAYAIISSVGLLAEFFELSPERRILKIQKYHVPEESVSIVSALCRYMEREDSKSAMTDSSSSVSSGPDSVKSHRKVATDGKRRKLAASTVEFDMSMNDFLHVKPFDEYTDERTDPSKASRFSDSGKSSSSHRPNDFGRSSFTPNNNPLSQTLELDTGPMRNLDHFKFSDFSSQEDYIGEIVDAQDETFLCEKFPSNANSTSTSDLAPEIEKEPVARNTRTARRLSFGKKTRPTFSLPADVDSNPKFQTTMQDPKQTYSQDISAFAATDPSFDAMSLEQHREMMGVHSADKFVRNPHGFSKQNNGIASGGETPFSNAIRLGQPQGSPWTIEFLNRVRQKSRIRKQTLISDTYPPCSGYSGNVTNSLKRKSPSTLDIYKYQGGSIPRKTKEGKRRKQSRPPSTSVKNHDPLPPTRQTWTPIDKRARKALSFTPNGNTRQTKLVWSSDRGQGLKKC